MGSVPVTTSGSTGGVIGSASTGISGLASSAVYHYHLSTTFPYTLGCFSTAFTSYTSCTALYPGCKSWRPNVYANGSAYFYDDWCPCGTGSGNGLTATAAGAIPTVSGATCWSSFSGISAPAAGAPVTGTVACSTSLLSALPSHGRRLLQTGGAVAMDDDDLWSRKLLQNEASAPIAGVSPAQGQPCDGWCAPPGFLDNFPHTVSLFLGLTAQQEGTVLIDRVFSVQIANSFPASYSSVQVWYSLPTSNATQSAAFIAALQLLPSNPSFISNLSTIFPGVQTVAIGPTLAMVGSSRDASVASFSTSDSVAPPPPKASSAPTAFGRLALLALALVLALAL